jgi:hypothetical protein
VRRDPFELACNYGAVLELCGDSQKLAAPERLLPAPKAEIEEALRLCIKVELASPSGMLETLEDDYVRLATFVSDDEAEVVNAHLANTRHVGPSAARAEALTVWERIVEQQRRRLVEIRAFIDGVLAASASAAAAEPPRRVSYRLLFRTR